VTRTTARRSTRSGGGADICEVKGRVRGRAAARAARAWKGKEEAGEKGSSL